MRAKQSAQTFSGVTATSLRELLHHSPSAVLNRLLAKEPALRRSVFYLFPLIPGSRDLCLRLALFLGELPSPTGGTIFAKCVREAVAKVETLGLVPFSVATHVHGFGAFCEGLLMHIPELLEIEVLTSDGVQWRPLEGGLSVWQVGKETPLRVTAVPDVDRSLAKPLRLFLLSRLIARHDLVRLGEGWPRVGGYVPC